MAFRLGQCVRSGIIDNSERGRITGKLEIEGIVEPVVLGLQGNAHPDMAGCVLKFRNPHADMIDPELADALRMEQKGFAGDISASQKRRVPRGYPEVEPEYQFDSTDFVLTNILYIEWFDHYNGRVVIEGVGYQWDIDLPRWKLTGEDMAKQAEQTEQAMGLFLNLAAEHFEEVNEEIRAEEEGLNPDADDEFVWEKRFQHSEDRVDAMLTLLDEAKTDEERIELLNRAFKNREEDDEHDEKSAWASDFEGVDETDPGGAWEDTDRIKLDGEFERTVDDLSRDIDGLLEGLADDTPCVDELMTLTVKVRTVINLIAENRAPFAPGFIIALLKREIARCHPIAKALPTSTRAEDQVRLDIVWKIRGALIQVAGHLRENGKV